MQQRITRRDIHHKVRSIRRALNFSGGKRRDHQLEPSDRHRKRVQINTMHLPIARAALCARTSRRVTTLPPFKEPRERAIGSGPTRTPGRSSETPQAELLKRRIQRPIEDERLHEVRRL